MSCNPAGDAGVGFPQPQTAVRKSNSTISRTKFAFLVMYLTPQFCSAAAALRHSITRTNRAVIRTIISHRNSE